MPLTKKSTTHINETLLFFPFIFILILGLLVNFVRVQAFDDNEMVGHEEWVMVQKSGTQFTVNGKPFYVSGFNTYWLMVFAADRENRGKVSEVLHQASTVGLNVCRTWAFNDGGYRALQVSPGGYDEEVFKVILLFLDAHYLFEKLLI